jgi:hypothetical protein
LAANCAGFWEVSTAIFTRQGERKEEWWLGNKHSKREAEVMTKMVMGSPLRKI